MKESRMDRVERDLAEFIKSVQTLEAAIEKDRIANAELRASIAELREAQKKTDEQLRKTDKKLENVSNTLGNLGVIDGKVAEDLFYRNVRHAFRQKNIAFSEVRRNVKKEGVAEYDIVAVNNGRILVVKVKKKMERHLLDEFLKDKLPKFRQIFPEYRDFQVVGRVGALVMQDEIGRYTEKKGLYVMTQNGEGGAMLANRNNFRAKEF